ncbi:nucleotidyltransferase domain-containing protein [Candidatus Woesearchaeota archaeon]|nr:nucleotidyltransferase domain-containing protein [Candidatus Woesearchaeota archaeon]
MLHKKDTKQKFIFGTECTFKIIEYIFNEPHRAFHLRELARLINFSTTAIAQSIEELNKYKIIKVIETNISKNIQADIESQAYKDYKLMFNIYRLMRYDIIKYLSVEFHNPECISVFGSFAKGEDTEQSDIDILIITPHTKPTHEQEFREFVKIIEKLCYRKTNFHILSSLDKSSNEFKNAAANGIVLHGYLKVM